MAELRAPFLRAVGVSSAGAIVDLLLSRFPGTQIDGPEPLRSRWVTVPYRPFAVTVSRWAM